MSILKLSENITHVVQVSIIIHELSHHPMIGNTRDYVATPEECRDLAKERRYEAEWNAWSYQYFIANDPPIGNADPNKPISFIRQGRCHSVIPPAREG